MDRRVLLASGLSLIASAAVAQLLHQQPAAAAGAATGPNPSYPTGTRAETYSRVELVNSVSDFFGVGAEAAGAIITKVFKDNGKPTAYIAGEEASGAITVGARYGNGLLYMKNQPAETVYWQGRRWAGTWAATRRGCSPCATASRLPTRYTSGSPAWRARSMWWAAWA